MRTRPQTEITLLLLEREPESYLPAARRPLARLATERAMPLGQLAEIAAILAELEAILTNGCGQEACVNHSASCVLSRCFAWNAALFDLQRSR